MKPSVRIRQRNTRTLPSAIVAQLYLPSQTKCCHCCQQRCKLRLLPTTLPPLLPDQMLPMFPMLPNLICRLQPDQMLCVRLSKRVLSDGNLVSTQASHFKKEDLAHRLITLTHVPGRGTFLKNCTENASLFLTPTLSTQLPPWNWVTLTKWNIEPMSGSTT